jgi:uncharacterized protein involved in exopolysaccharide biosynthesis
MEEEWLGELNAISSRPGKLAFAIALTLTRRQAFAAPGEDSMTEIHERTAGPFAAFNGRKTLLFLTTAIFAIAAYGVSFLLPVLYASESLILVRPREVPTSLVVDLIGGSVEERLKAIEQTMMSRRNLVEILREFPQLGSKTLSMDRRIEGLRKDISISFNPTTGGTPSISYFRLRYVGPDPTLAQKVASKLTILFLERDGETRGAMIAGTNDFLRRQLDALAERLTEKGNELARLRAANGPEDVRILALDYEVLESTYKTLSAKYGDAKLAVALESEQKGGKFMVLDPANLPKQPVSPNRLAITGMGALAGLALGGVAVFGLDRRRKRALA